MEKPMAEETSPQLRALQAFSEVVAHTTDLEAVYQAAHRAVAEAVGEPVSVLIAQYDPGAKLISIPFAHDGQQSHSLLPYPLQEDVISTLICTRQPVLQGEPGSDGPEETQTITHLWFPDKLAQSLLGVPMLVADEPVGAVLLQDFEQAHRFRQSDMQWLAILAGQLATRLQAADVVEHTRQQLQYSRLLFEITSKIHRSADMKTILAVTATELGKVFSARRTHIEVDVESLLAPQEPDPASLPADPIAPAG
jgi:GAF domain-containing protein